MLKYFLKLSHFPLMVKHQDFICCPQISTQSNCKSLELFKDPRAAEVSFDTRQDYLVHLEISCKHHGDAVIRKLEKPYMVSHLLSSSLCAGFLFLLINL